MNVKNIVVFIAAVLLGGAAPAMAEDMSEARKREIAVELAKISAKKELRRLAEIESEVYLLPASDKELVIFMASDLLNRKVMAVRDKRAESSPSAEHEVTDALIAAVSRLAELAQSASWSAAAECHVAEVRVLSTRRNGLAAEPANCRMAVYGRDLQARYIEQLETERGKRLRDLSNRWAASATMLAFHLVDIEQNKARDLVATSTPKRGETDGICAKQLGPIREFPPEMQEAVLFVASRRITEKFIEVAYRKDATPEDRLWGYKIMAIGHHILTKVPLKSAKGALLLGELSTVSSRFIRGEIGFGAFKAQAADTTRQIDALMAVDEDRRRRFIQRNEEPVAALSNCIVVHAMANASSKDVK